MTRSLRVLVVDDDLVSRKICARLLATAGHAVEIAEGGAAAIARSQDGALDLIVMDLRMAELDGFAAAREIRRDERERGTRPVAIIALTGDSLADARARCVAAGMNGCLSKPLDLHRLGVEVERVVPTATDSNLASAVDLDGLSERLGGDPELVRIVATAAAEELTRLVVLLRTADANDGRVLAEAAHRLRGSLLGVAADPAAVLAAQLEDAAASDGHDACAAILRELLKALERTIGELEKVAGA